MRRGRYKTDIERIMQDALKAGGIEAVQEYPIRCKYGYIADFAVPEHKLIIECDGEPWHGGKRDMRRDGYLKSRGWTVLRFKGQTILTDVDSCISRIREVISC